MRLLQCLFVTAVTLAASRATAAPLDSVPVRYFDDVPYVSLLGLAERYGMEVDYDPGMFSMTVSRAENSLTVADASATALFNDTPVNLKLPSRLVRGALFAPAHQMLPLFSRLVPGDLGWNDREGSIISAGTVTSIERITYENLANGTLVRITLTEPLDYAVDQSDSALVVRLSDGNFDPLRLFAQPPTGLVADARAVQLVGETRLVFGVDDTYANYSATTTAGNREILVSLFRKRETASLAAPADTGTFDVSAPPLTGESDIWRIDTVVIDPGHGGRDPGAVGPRGTLEKDIVLNVALELKELLVKNGEIDVVMTRESDVFVPLYERARIATQAKGKLFISVHANASTNRSAHGVEVFFLSAAKTEYAMDVARRENASAHLFEDNLEHYGAVFNDQNLPQEIIDIQLEMASNVFLKESQDMCTLLLDSTCRSTSQVNRGVKQAGFLVMTGTQPAMPSVLFEIGFISNPDEERTLTRSSHQKRLAQSMFDAILAFKERHERGLFSRSN